MKFRVGYINLKPSIKPITGREERQNITNAFK